MKIKSLSAALTLVGALLCGEGKAAIATNHVYFDPGSLEVNLGDTFSLVLKGQAFNDGLDGGSVDLSFDNAILHADSVVVNSTLWSLNQPGAINNAAGKIEFTDFGQFGANLASGPFDIATFTFVAIGSGSSAINLSVNDADPFSSDGNLITPDFGNALVKVSGLSTVPLPGSAWLMFSAIAGFAELKRRTNQGV